MGIAVIKPGMLTRDKLHVALYKALGIQKPPPVQTGEPVQVKAICAAYKHSRMPAWQTGFKVVRGNKKPTTGTNDNYHVIPPESQLMRSRECFHCHKHGHYACHCCTKCRADRDHPGTTVIKAISAQSTAPVIISTNKFSILEKEVLNDPTPTPHHAPPLQNMQRIKDLIADSLWALNTDKCIKLAGEARRILKIPPGARPVQRMPKRA